MKNKTLSTARQGSRGSFVGLAIGDALGAPVEFQERGAFAPVTGMCAGGYFRLPAGAWTDDTAMALCLAQSLLVYPRLNPTDLMDRFCRWLFEHENTSTGRCVGVGQNTFRTLVNYRRTGETFARQMTGRSDGNGAIMRLAPVAAMHWRDPQEALRIAALQSRTTHCSELSAAACELLCAILCDLIAGRAWEDACQRTPDPDWPQPIREIAAGCWKGRNASELGTTGFVVSTLETALWAVEEGNSFESSLLIAVNLGGDADTIGAVTGQVAGARYGYDAIPAHWLDMLALRAELDEVSLSLSDKGAPRLSSSE